MPLSLPSVHPCSPVSSLQASRHNVFATSSEVLARPQTSPQSLRQGGFAHTKGRGAARSSYCVVWVSRLQGRESKIYQTVFVGVGAVFISVVNCISNFVAKNSHAPSTCSAFHFKNLTQFESGESRMCKIERDRNSRDAVRSEPFAR
mgnify:CR=1 FL=1